MLERTDGPPCPTCGCTDTGPAAARPTPWFDSPQPDLWPNAPRVAHACNHCHRRFTPAPPSDPQPLAVQRCPHCGHPQTRVTSTRGPLRYHKCQRCAGTFRTQAPADY